ncbi:evolutionarily conserved signaling intermediate in Toll pathway, mitochondrial [Amia ocellicauda]|uniref:evolutionarily conserved signaling intermediate in Toll pathway, mitochondrial n=1 Tax=Amia ocellicauda TaxID=2972642 RepID=UPI003463F7C1
MSRARFLTLAQELGTLVPRARAAALSAAPHRVPTAAFPNTGNARYGPSALRCFHRSSRLAEMKPTCTDGGQSGIETGRSLATPEDLFERLARDSRTKATFNRVLDTFVKRDVRRRGHVEFIYAALSKMPEFGVERDLSVYNKLLDVFPKEVFVPHNFIQRMFNHYPRQQECAVQLLEQMENYGIMPNVETKVLLVQIFGLKGHPVRKYQRLLYWFPRFKNINPYPLPEQLPQDPLDLARLSLARITDNLDAEVTVYQMPYSDVSDAGEEISQPHIVGIQSPQQRSLLARHNPSRPVFVEGPFPLWLRKTCVFYYVLRADPPPPQEQVEEPLDPERSLYYPLVLDLDLDRHLGDDDRFEVDEVAEGPVFAMCMAGSGDQATLFKWISGLQETNPVLGRTPTVFRLESVPREIQSAAEAAVEEEHPRSQGMKQ